MTTHETIEAAVRNVLARVLGREVAPGDEIRRDAEPIWDSLKHVEILFQLEDDLDVRFDEAEMPDLDSVAKLVESVERHRAP